MAVYVSTNCFHVADLSFETNTSGCTDVIYHANLDILWVLAWDSQRKGGQFSRCVYHMVCLLGHFHFLICFFENFSLVGYNRFRHRHYQQSLLRYNSPPIRTSSTLPTRSSCCFQADTLHQLHPKTYPFSSLGIH